MPSVAALFDRAFSSFKERWRPLAAIMAVELVGRYALMALAGLAVLAVLAGGLDLSQLEGLEKRLQDIDALLPRIVPLAVVLCAFATAFAAFEAWVLTALFWAVEEPAPRFSDALRAGVGHMAPFGWVMTLSSLIVLGGLLLFVVPGLILAFLFLLAPNAYFVEGRTGWQALARARDAVRGRLGPVALRLGAAWFAFFAAAATIQAGGIPFLGELFNIVGAPLVALYHSALFRELARGAAPQYAPAPMRSAEAA